ncbi:MAG: HD domain-containing protein [Candidatus Pacebacteria bacterium]|nr:HD domain-containing protein [Candidatus Paceibacterota bacterium]
MDIPPEIRKILKTLQKAGYEAHIVGGCVRDLLRGVTPHDWDIATSAVPEEIQAVFDKAGYKTFYENDFGTVSLVTDSEDQALKTIEITPFRVESQYSDKRHPDQVRFAKTLADDLSRRDFTINALALGEKITDLFGGQDDLENKIIRAVGDAQERFREDGLRLMRAVRFAATLSDDSLWTIDGPTRSAIEKNAALLQHISRERIRDELVKILMSPNGAKGIELLRELGLLQFIIPELLEGFGVGQNKHHIYEIYQHNLLSLRYACENGYSLEVRLASLLHDIAKPRTKRGEGSNATFYGHETIGAKMAGQILRRLCFSKKQCDKVTKLVKYHLFYYNVDEVGASSVRRLLKNVGPENIEELLQVRKADRIGSGVPKAEPYKLRHLKYLLEKVVQDPIAPKMLAINGQDIMKLLNIQSGPKVGHILSYLLSQVLSDPKKNKKELLEKETERLGALSDQELQKLANRAKKDVEQVETKRDNMTKQKYWVT